MNEQAIRRIILAQVASDGGKGIGDLLDVLPEEFKPAAKKIWLKGYRIKDSLLEEACQIIARHKACNLRFFVTEDKEGVARYIVYFDIKVDGKRLQASFHSFSYRWAKWVRGSVASRGNWDHKDSRETCKVLLKYLRF